MHLPPALATSSRFLPLLVVAFLAAFVPLTLGKFKRLAVPVMVGEILAGVLVGQSGLGWVHGHDPVLDLLAEIGFVFLMFIAGMEIDFSAFGWGGGGKNEHARQPSPLGLAGMYFLATLALAAGVAFVIWKMRLATDLPLMALILSTTSLGVVVPVLKESGFIGTRYGQTLLLSALIADFVTMLLITVEVAVLSRGLTLDILLVGGLFVAVFVLYRLGLLVLPVLTPLLDEMSHATSQAKVRLAIFLMLSFVVLAELLGAEIILGAFLAGVLVSVLLDPADNSLRHQLEISGYGFFIPIFFIMVGVRFNLSAVFGSLQALGLVLFLLVGAVLVKGLPAAIFRRAFGMRESLAGGVLLSARLSLIIAAAEIGRQLGVLSESVVMAVILVAMMTVTAAPVLFNRLLAGHTPVTERKPWVIAGAGTLGMQVAEMLRMHGRPVRLIDPDPKRVERARARGFRAFAYQSDDELEQHLTAAHGLICTHNEGKTAMQVCRVARTRLGMENILAMTRDPQANAEFRKMGIRPYSPVVLLATMLAMLARNPDFTQLLAEGSDEQDVCECVIENRALVGKRVRELPLPPTVLVLSIRRGEDFIIPHGDTRLEYGDRLTLLGTLEGLEAAIQTMMAGA